MCPSSHFFPLPTPARLPSAPFSSSEQKAWREFKERRLAQYAYNPELRRIIEQLTPEEDEELIRGLLASTAREESLLPSSL